MDFSDISIQISQSPLIHHSLKTLEELESEIFFSIACNKDHLFRAKYDLIHKNGLNKIYVIANNTNFGHISSVISGIKSILCLLMRLNLSAMTVI